MAYNEERKFIDLYFVPSVIGLPSRLSVLIHRNISGGRVVDLDRLQKILELW